ncbi:hypothetical protein JQ559_00160 [Bradyrhizobium viridifuturi]|jgi:Na+-transporting NADH:ubiquinone oxidoreductase subunit NqrB|uniref:hypothetical protein n=2 Tax=Pseudomonadota TaxID=1224 RepID=UPI0003960AA4|nr:hypothetical protein [Escherichia coli]ERF81992.1 MAG: glucosamine-fructose-6-phosphate aminotransferase (isomerizing) [Bradyrhizobium sp. DFCI-1]MBR1018279.1 hypothetical protein [Bradyrhizobium viridifuturi]MCA3577174.1 hypothetical protein [Bradyrhizobium sp.]MCA3796383.1 hypothetical protein [Burkholderia sp.]OYU64109.1 MAG: hypothetical protein CFE30_00385 [Bradyrhizobium sp. PARBB1]PSO25887.1 hypothetical protein C7G43_15620 [Bradyrhizobium sp. MOS004]QRI67971.1 hypothetical protein
MWEMTKNSIVLFFRGKLFADPRMVTRQLAIGIVVTAILFVGLAKAGAPLWLAALVAALLGGGLQPYLFKDLRYL